LFVVLIMTAMIWACIKVVQALFSSSEEEGSGEQARLLQGINSKLSSLEKRIESLETIIVDNERRTRS
jgi:hypothetical protein